MKYAVILGAGNGERMLSNEHIYNKVCYPILGKPLMGYVLDAIKPLEFEEIIIVAGVGKEKTKEFFEDKAKIVIQEKQLGTGDAVKAALKSLPNDESDILVVYGDAPLILSDTYFKMYKRHVKNGADATILTAIVTESIGQNRIIRHEKTGEILYVNDFKEESDAGYLTTEIEAGAYLIKAKYLQKYIKNLQKDHENGEFSLISIFGSMVNDGLKVEGFVLTDNVEAYSVNDRTQLARAATVIKRRVNTKLMLSGVSIEDTRTAFISPDVEIKPDTIISPNTTILGKCKIGVGNLIGPNTYLRDVEIGSHNQITHSYVVDSKIGDNKQIGPYQHMKNNEIIKGDK